MRKKAGKQSRKSVEQRTGGRTVEQPDKGNSKAAEQADLSVGKRDENETATGSTVAELAQPKASPTVKGTTSYERWAEAGYARQNEALELMYAHVRCGFEIAHREGTPPITMHQGLTPYLYLKLESMLELSRDELGGLLRLSPETLEQRILGKQPFSPAETEALLRVYRLIAMVEGGKGEPDRENYVWLGTWLRSPHTSLGSIEPFALLDTECGGLMVFQLLLDDLRSGNDRPKGEDHD